LGLLLAGLFAALYFFLIRPQIGAVCVDKTVPVISAMIEGDHPLSHYQKKGDALFTVACIAMLLGAFVFGYRVVLKSILTSYFSETSSPWNLAIFRVVFFGFILLTFKKANVLWYSQLPSELIIPPFGWGHILTYLPINPEIANLACTIFVIACFCALVGFGTRYAIWTAALSGMYVLGIPQFYGKVNHYHQWIWFMMILAVSRCADVLSLDSVRRGFRMADRGEKLGAPADSVGYALPLRFVWLLMGVAYFFPGLWKVIRSQWHWAFSDNLKYQMYSKWFELSGWTPAFRIDQHPVLYKLSGCGTLVFELTFIVMVLFPFLRPFAFVGGLAFHNLTNMFMRISFMHMQICYVSLLDWSKIGAWLGKVLYKQDLIVLFDGNCTICRRTIATFQRFDILGRVCYINALDTPKLKELQLTWIEPAALMRDMHAVAGRKTWKGYECYRTLALRIPILWPLWPLMWFWPVAVVGRMIYRKVADARACSIRKAVPVSTAGGSAINTAWVKVIGTSLIVVNVLFGVSRISDAWPFACYPTFDRMVMEPKSETLLMTGVKGEVEEKLDLGPLKNKFTPTRFRGMIRSILHGKDKARREVQLKAAFGLLADAGVDVTQYSKIRFYKVFRSTVPEEYNHPPLSSSLIFEYDVKDL